MEENLEENQNPAPSFENLDNQSPYSSNPEPQYSTPPSPKKRSPRKFLYLLGVIVVILILLNAVRFISSRGKSSAPTPTPTISLEAPSPSPTEQPTSSPTEAPTPTPKATSNSVDSATGLDRSKLSVAVQNGSGEAGVGAKASTLLKNLGYDVVSTGNADNFNYTNVTIKVKSTQQAYLPLLNKDLSANYSVGTTSADLTATSSADALVIIGK